MDRVDHEGLTGTEIWRKKMSSRNENVFAQLNVFGGTSIEQLQQCRDQKVTVQGQLFLDDVSFDVRSASAIDRLSYLIGFAHKGEKREGFGLCREKFNVHFQIKLRIGSRKRIVASMAYCRSTYLISLVGNKIRYWRNSGTNSPNSPSNDCRQSWKRSTMATGNSANNFTEWDARERRVN